FQERIEERLAAVPAGADPDRQKVDVEVNGFSFGNLDSVSRRAAEDRTQRKEMFVASRLSKLAYLPFERGSAEGERARQEIRNSARIYGFDKVDFVHDEFTHTQVVIAYHAAKG